MLMAAFSAVSGVVFAVVFRNHYVPSNMAAPESKTTPPHYLYQEAIYFGTVDIRYRMDAEIMLGKEYSVLLPNGAVLEKTVGLVEKGAPFYMMNGGTLFAEDGMHILASELLDNGEVKVTYRLQNDDTICFWGTEWESCVIRAGDIIYVSNDVGIVTVDKVEKTGNKTVIYSCKGDYSNKISTGMYGEMKVRWVENCFYIDNSVLTVPLGANQYLLDIYNPYDPNDVFFYQKEISVLPFSEKYSIVLSGNVREYERVLINEH